LALRDVLQRRGTRFKFKIVLLIIIIIIMCVNNVQQSCEVQHVHRSWPFPLAYGQIGEDLEATPPKNVRSPPDKNFLNVIKI